MDVFVSGATRMHTSHVTQDKSCAGLMKDHGQQARASENFAGPVDFETPRPDLPVPGL